MTLTTTDKRMILTYAAGVHLTDAVTVLRELVKLTEHESTLRQLEAALGHVKEADWRIRQANHLATNRDA